MGFRFDFPWGNQPIAGLGCANPFVFQIRPDRLAPMTSISKRHFLTLSAATALTACAPVAGIQAQPTASPRPEVRPEKNPAFDAWIARFRPRAAAAGISARTLDAALPSAGFLPGVVQRDRTQIQTRRTLEEYLSIATSDERLSKGRAAFARHRQTLQAIENRYGVEAKIVCAIWGMESTFGERRGEYPVISATATLAFDGRRGAFWESQLIAALKIIDAGDITADRMLGSWAGAMGHTQFIPTSFRSFAVDFNGDGRRDIWGDDPTDALASTAAYLSRNGWRQGLPWGAEAGTTNIQGRIIQPQAGGVRFTVTHNFNVIKTYNNSDFYAIAVGHLGDRIAGAGPLQGSFPPDANGLTRADRVALQTALTDRGYDVGTIDGVIGDMTTAAISDFEARQGLPVTGEATRGILARLR